MDGKCNALLPNCITVFTDIVHAKDSVLSFNVRTCYYFKAIKTEITKRIHHNHCIVVVSKLTK